MRAVGIKALKNRLSEYVKLAASGEVVLVTDRDRVVAELSPPREGRSTALDDAELADLVRTGIVTPPTLSVAEPPPRIPYSPSFDLLKDLDHDRQDR